VSYKVRVNGTEHEIDAEGDTPLLWVLRDILNMTGTKFGCGVALCGACTVQANGSPVRSCQLPLESVGDMQITTIEGIGDTELGKRVQHEWLSLDVPQCGYCQGGQILAAAALLAHTPEPTDADIERAMSGNICRCGCYGRIRTAIRNAASALKA